MDKLRDDFNQKKCERCVRLDFHTSVVPETARSTLVGLDELERAMVECTKRSFQRRQAAYDDEVRLPREWPDAGFERTAV